MAAESRSSSKGMSLPPPTNLQNIQGTTVKLDGTNFLLWLTSFQRFVNSQHKKKYLTEEEPKQKIGVNALWEEENDLVTRMVNSMQPNIAKQVMMISSAKVMWETLHQIHSQQSNVARLYQVEQIHNLKKGSMSLSDYFGTLKNLWDEQDLYQPLTSDLEKMRAQCEQIRVIQFLAGLGPEYDPIKNQIMTTDEMPSLVNVYGRISRALFTSPTELTTQDFSAMTIFGGRTRGVRKRKSWRRKTIY